MSSTEATLRLDPEQFEQLLDALTNRVVDELKYNQTFNTEEAARYLRMSKQNLEILRLKGDGPRYSKLGRSVRYRRESLDEWILIHEQRHTAEG